MARIFAARQSSPGSSTVVLTVSLSVRFAANTLSSVSTQTAKRQDSKTALLVHTFTSNCFDMQQQKHFYTFTGLLFYGCAGAVLRRPAAKVAVGARHGLRRVAVGARHGLRPSRGRGQARIATESRVLLTAGEITGTYSGEATADIPGFHPECERRRIREFRKDAGPSGALRAHPGGGSLS